MLNFNNQPGTLSAEKSGGAITRSASFLKRLLIVTLFCALSFMLSAPSLVQAEDLQEGTPSEQPSTNVQPVNTADPAELITKAVPENQAPAKANTQADDGLEIGPEIVGTPVGAAVKAPTINPVFYDATTITGGNLAKARVNKKTVIATVHVTLKAKDGTVKATLEDTPKRGNTWKVDLPAGTKVEKGDTVTVYQQIGDDKSPEVTANAQQSIASQTTLAMPSGEIWIEQTNNNQVNEDEQAEAVQMFKDANPGIADKIKSVKFSINGTEHAYYEVTYTDESTSGKIEAQDLKIKTVTEHSAAPTIEKVQVTDGQVTVTLAKEVAEGTKFNFVKTIDRDEVKNFDEGGSCVVIKSTAREMSQAVHVDGKTVTFPIKDDDLKLGTGFGITVKEPHKFRSCAKSEPVPTTPAKVAVRDPKKLTDDDKKAIDKAIREANTVNGVSKLPDGTGLNVGGVPAVIEFDKDGNVRIISPNDLTIEKKENGKPVFKKNADGTYIIKNPHAKVYEIAAKDLIKNLKPQSPAIAVNTDDGTVTITPPAYENPGDDTDLASYTFTYTDASGAEKTVTATRTVDADTGKTTWTSDGATVDADTGVVTLEIKDLAVGATITAKAKDNGGLIPTEEKPLESDPASKTLETVDVTYDGNGGEGTMTDGKLKDGKTLNKGSKYKILDNKFKAPDDTQEFKAWEVDGKEVAPGAKITVKDNTVVKAVWKKIKVNVTYDGNGGKGSMDGATVDKGSEYTVLPNAFKAPDDTQEFDTWEVNGKKVAPGSKIKADKDTVIKAIWKKIPVTVSYDANGGSGEMKPETVDKGSDYTVLPNAFKAPDDTQKFDTWEVDGKEVAPGAKITVKDNTVVKAIWKDIEYKVDFDGNGGSGDMKGKTVKKGATVELPASGFTPPAGKEFNGWEIDGKAYQVGESITVNGDVTVKALWKNKPVSPSTTPGKDKPGKQGKSQPQNQLSRTGANGMYSLYASLLLLATGGLFVISRRRRAQR